MLNLWKPLKMFLWKDNILLLSNFRFNGYAHVPVYKCKTYFPKNYGTFIDSTYYQLVVMQVTDSPWLSVTVCCLTNACLMVIRKWRNQEVIAKPDRKLSSFFPLSNAVIKRYASLVKPNLFNSFHLSHATSLRAKSFVLWLSKVLLVNCYAHLYCTYGTFTK